MMSVSNDEHPLAGVLPGGPPPASADGLTGGRAPFRLGGSDALGPADTEKPLNLAGLAAGLRGLREHVPQTAKAFDPRRPEQTFKDCERHLASRTQRVWGDFWEQCEPFWDSIRMARDRVRMWPSECREVADRILESSKVAKIRLTEAFRTSICQETDRPRPGQPGDVTDLRDQVKKACLEIDKHRIAVTGELKGVIPPPETGRTYWVGALGAMLCGLLVVLVDTDFFRQSAGYFSALDATTMALVLIVACLLTAVVGITGKRWIYWRRASTAFKKNFPDSVIPGTDTAVEFRDLASGCRIRLVFAFVAMVVGSAALLVWRSRLAEIDELLKRTMPFAWDVLLVLWLLASVEFLMGSPYDPMHFATLKALRAEWDDAETKMRAALKWLEPADPAAFQLPAAAAIAGRDYGEIIKKLRRTLVDAENDARRIRNRYLSRREELSDALGDLLAPAYERLLGDLIDAIRVPCLQAGIDPAFTLNMEKIEIARLCAADDEKTFKLISNFEPSIAFPEEEVILDLEGLYREMRNEIHEKWTRERIDYYQGELTTPIGLLH